jgi:peptide deformylase
LARRVLSTRIVEVRMSKANAKERVHGPHATRSGTYVRVHVRTVVERPHPLLAQRSPEVDPLHRDVVAVAAALVATMRASPACVGLAAPQIGEPMRLFCMDVTNHRKARSCAGLVVVANPIVVARYGNVVMREGCMSLPHLTGNVARAAEVSVTGIEPGTGEPVTIHADGFEARCLQHEIDHLDGFVFMERVFDPVADLFSRKSYE